MRILIVLLLSAMILIGGCSSGEGYFHPNYNFAAIEKVAVVEVTGYFKQEGVRNQIASFMEGELLKRGYTVIERHRVQVILDEQKFQASDITSPNDVVKAGQILNVPVIILIDVPEFGEQISMTAKMLDATNGSILWVGTETQRTGEFFGTVIAATAGALIGSTVDPDNKTTGVVIGGVAGGAAGYALSPKAAERARKVMKKVCDTLPRGY